ncbi:MAG: phosphoadenylyl-sulfate reductase [bacterium]|nr:phosphoadenylyl-sulfate reductase [Gammaproteobacteria bacterium]HIL96837.1 phosphoadenylyl-sulfate reductase [Pseudomonadales bacterium]
MKSPDHGQNTIEISHAEPNEIIKLALDSHSKISISFSGAEDVVLIDMACNVSDNVQVFSLDTGRLHPQTYQFIEQVRAHYGLEIDILSPDADAVANLVKSKGLYSFYKDGHNECCAVRKIEPLRRHLGGLDAWVTGQRRDQSPTRRDVPLQQEDQAFSNDQRVLLKYNPLANWSSAQVWQYIREHDVPYNKLHDQGFKSIGCEPCTRSVGPNQHERAGRWWWEEETKKECGLHMINIVES